MEIDVVEAPPGGVEADVLVFPVHHPVALTEAAEGLDRLLDGRLARLIDEGEIRCRRGSVALTHTDGRLAASGSGRDVQTGAAEC